MSSGLRRARPASFSVKAGSVEVPVYFRRRMVDGKRYPEFTVVFYGADGKRLRRSFGDPGKARMEAQRVAASLSRGHSEATQFTAAEATLYGRAVSLLKPLDIPLVAAIEEYVAARALLPAGTSLKDAARDLARNLHLTDSRPVRDMVDELLADRESAERSEVHLRDLRTRLGRFADVFQCPLGSVSAAMVRDFIHDLKTSSGKPVTNRTRKNCLRIVASLYHFAGKRRYIPPTLVEDVRGIEAPKVVSGEAAIWTPKEMRALLAAAKPYLIPALAIGGFAGLRTAEIARLDWRDIRIGEGVIILAATKTKTASRRVVPILPNLSEWLKPHQCESGAVSQAATANQLSIQFARTSKRAGFDWLPNALRHSFCSYRLAVTHDPARVATEAGNSPAMIHRCYKALTTEAEGLEWFSIVPDQP